VTLSAAAVHDVTYNLALGVHMQCHMSTARDRRTFWVTTSTRNHLGGEDSNWVPPEHKSELTCSVEGIRITRNIVSKARYKLRMSFSDKRSFITDLLIIWISRSLLQVEVLLVVTSSIVLVGYHRFRGPRCLYLQGEDGGILSQHYTASQPRRRLEHHCRESLKTLKFIVFMTTLKILMGWAVSFHWTDMFLVGRSKFGAQCVTVT